MTDQAFTIGDWIMKPITGHSRPRVTGQAKFAAFGRGGKRLSASRRIMT